MGFEFRQDMPIYMQIQRDIAEQIVAGKLQPGERLPSVRDLSVRYQVNPNTLQRAMLELDRSGLTATERTSGRFVTEDTARIVSLRRELLGEIVKDCWEHSRNLNFTWQELKAEFDRLEGLNVTQD